MQYSSPEAPQRCGGVVIGSGKTVNEYDEVRYVGMYTKEALLRRIFGETSANQHTAIPCVEPRMTGERRGRANVFHLGHRVAPGTQSGPRCSWRTVRRVTTGHPRGTDEKSATTHSECVKRQSLAAAQESARVPATDKTVLQSRTSSREETIGCLTGKRSVKRGPLKRWDARVDRLRVICDKHFGSVLE